MRVISAWSLSLSRSRLATTSPPMPPPRTTTAFPAITPPPSEGDHLFSPGRPLGYLIQRGSVRSLNQERISDTTSVQASAAAADLGSLGSGRPDHLLQVVVAVGRRLALHGAAHGVTHQEHLHLGSFLAGQTLGQAEAVVAALSPVSGVVEDQQITHSSFTSAGGFYRQTG